MFTLDYSWNVINYKRKILVYNKINMYINNYKLKYNNQILFNITEEVYLLNMNLLLIKQHIKINNYLKTS